MSLTAEQEVQLVASVLEAAAAALGQPAVAGGIGAAAAIVNAVVAVVGKEGVAAILAQEYAAADAIADAAETAKFGPPPAVVP